MLNQVSKLKCFDRALIESSSLVLRYWYLGDKKLGQLTQ